MIKAISKIFIILCCILLPLPDNCTAQQSIETIPGKRTMIYYDPTTLSAAQSGCINLVPLLYDSTVEYVSALLHIKFDDHLNLFFYPSFEAIKKATGIGAMHPDIAKASLHLINGWLLTPDIHEIVHIIINKTYGFPKNAINEGIAQAIDTRWLRKHNDEWVLIHLEDKKLYPLRRLISQFDILNVTDNSNNNITYPEVGSFIEFLIHKIGMNKFIELFKQSVADKVFETGQIKLIEKFCNKSIKEIENDWLKSIKKTWNKNTVINNSQYEFEKLKNFKVFYHKDRFVNSSLLAKKILDILKDSITLANEMFNSETQEFAVYIITDFEEYRKIVKGIGDEFITDRVLINMGFLYIPSYLVKTILEANNFCNLEEEIDRIVFDSAFKRYIGEKKYKNIPLWFKYGLNRCCYKVKKLEDVEIGTKDLAMMEQMNSFEPKSRKLWYKHTDTPRKVVESMYKIFGGESMIKFLRDLRYFSFGDAMKRNNIDFTKIAGSSSN